MHHSKRASLNHFVSLGQQERPATTQQVIKVFAPI